MNIIIYFEVFSAWSQYSSCSETCGNGSKVRSRQCISGICSLAAKTELYETHACYEGDCKSFLKNFVFQSWSRSA